MLNTFFYFYNLNLLLQILNYFSPDGSISLPDIALKRFLFWHLFALVFIFIFLRQNVIYELKKSFHDSNLIHKLGFCIIFILICFYFIFYYQPLAKKISNLHLLYQEDGLFEYMTAIFFFLSAIAILCSIRGHELFLTKLFKTLFGLFALLIFLEEVSWGQRILNIEVPPELKKINTQNELNLHNIFNYLFPILYACFSFIFFAIFFLSNKISEVLDKKIDDYIFLRSELAMYSSITLFIFLTCVLMPSHYYDNELLEEVYSVIFLSYSLDQYRIVNSAKNDYQ